MSRIKDYQMEQEEKKWNGEDSFTRFYKYVNVGQEVEVYGKIGTIIEFTKEFGDNTKVVWKEGGETFINRDELEDYLINYNK